MQTNILTAGLKVLALPAIVFGLAMSATKPANAVPVALGANLSLSGTTAATRPELAGTVLEDRVREFTITAPSGAVVKGTFQDRVVKRNSTGALDFSFRIKNSAESKGSIIIVRRSDYSAFPSVDIDFRTDGLGSVGAKAVSFAGGNDGGVQFDFNNDSIKPGQESRFHFIGARTTSYKEVGLATLYADNGGAKRFKIFSPVPNAQTPTVALPNLTTRIVGPSSAKRTEDISKLIKVLAYNIGNRAAPGTSGTLSPANGYMIDVMLSSDQSVPAGYASYLPNYSEDVLLLGGRVSNTQDLAAGANASYAAGATIPRDTPPGRYYLAVRIDSGNKVLESNENDNTYFLPIQIF